MPTFGEVRRWRAAPVEAAQAGLKTDVDALVEAGELLQERPETWVGEAADAAAEERGTLVSAVSQIVAEASAVRRALADAADALEVLESDVTAVVEHASRERFSISDSGVVTDISEPVELPEDEVAAYEAERRAARDAVVADVEAALRLASAIDADLAAVLARAEQDAMLHVGDPRLSALLGGVQGSTGRPAPPSDATPAENAEWWASLTATQQLRILEDEPDLVAALDGVPAAVRDEANRARMPELVEDAEAEVARLQAELDDIPTWAPGMSGIYRATLAELEQAEAKVVSLEEVQSLLDLPDGRQLLLLDTTGERVMAAVARGDVDTAEHVAVFTPGFTTTVDGSLASYDRHMDSLRTRALDELDRTGRHDEDVAIVTWIGYEAPQWSEVIGPNSVASAGAAERGAESLAPFLTGIGASRGGDVHLTALGHSYGSTTTGLALQQETGVDDFVAYGSPGLGTTDLDDIHVNGDVYYAEARRDAVGDAAHFGTDPSHLDGVIQLSTSEEEHPDGQALDEVTGHSAYTQQDSTSQYNIAAIIAGLPDEAITGSNRGFGDVLSFPVIPWGG